MGLFRFVFIAACLICIVGEPIRTKSEVSTNYVIDIYVVVDSGVYARWENLVKNETGETAVETLKTKTEGRIKEYFSLLFYQSNLRLNSLQKYLQYGISIQIVDMAINVSIPNVKRSIDINEALNEFRNWIIAAKVTFDHSILMISEYFHWSVARARLNPHLLIAPPFVSRMCSVKGYSVSIILDIGAFQSSYHLTHELGHSLGAIHDGDGSSGSCPYTDLYIMTRHNTESGLSSHPWQFSNCSAVNINQYITDVLSRSDADKNIRNCLSTSLQPIKEFIDTINVKVGQVYPPDKQCQMLYGTSSRACPTRKGLENICTCMGCTDPQVPTQCKSYVYFAAEWTSCGDKKWCSLGQCISEQSAPNISDCYLGDIAEKLDKYTCSQEIQDNPMLCYKIDINKACCNSFGKAAAGNPESCLYGDRVVGCTMDRCADAEFRKNCCKTCHCPGSVQTLDGMSCSERVNWTGINECYNLTVATKCCSECDKLRPNSSIPSCYYGDMYLDDYCQTAPCSTNKKACCLTCSEFNSASLVSRWNQCNTLFVFLGFLNIFITFHV